MCKQFRLPNHRKFSARMRIFVLFNAHNLFELIKVNEKILFKLQRQAQHDIATTNCNYCKCHAERRRIQFKKSNPPNIQIFRY